MKRFSLLSAMIAALVTCSSTTTRAETWASTSVGGDWSVPGNWTPATVPNGPGAVANFDTGTANRAYTYGQDITIGTLNITNNSTFTNIWSVVDQTSPSLTFDSGGTGPATINITGTNGGTAQSNIIRGDVKLNSDLVIDVPRGGTSSAAGVFGFQRGVISGPGGITKNGGGFLSFADAGEKAYEGPTVINDGRFRTNPAAALLITKTSSVTINPGGQFAPEGAADFLWGQTPDVPLVLNGFGLGPASPIGYFPGAFRTPSGITQGIQNKIVLGSAASINVVSNNSAVPGKLYLENEVSGPGRLIANQKPGLISREGFLYFAVANTYSGGTTVEQGTLTVGLDLGGGVISPDANLGTGNVFVDGTAPSFDPNPDGASSGKLVIESGITNAIADSAYLYLTGGGLESVADRGYITLPAGYNDNIGGLMVGGLSGVGGTVLGPGVYGSTASGAANPGLANPDEYFAGAGTVTVVPVGVPGDYNDNGVVDAADYVVWRKGGLLANDFTPGNQASDYDFWRSRLGATTNPGNGSVSGLEAAAIPEPATILLAGCLGSLVALGRHRK